MPSRRKKALRSSKLTHSFFNQDERSVCPCCAEELHSHAMDPANIADSDPNIEYFRGAMSSLWKGRYDNLTSRERQGVHAAIERSPRILAPESVLQALRLALKQTNDESATTNKIPLKESFNLDILDDNAKVYDELCQKYKDEEEYEMTNLAGLVTKFASIASDTTCSAKDRLIAELDIHDINVRSKLTVPLISCLRQVQLFNIQKRFGFEEESYQALGNDDKKRRGEDAHVELPLSFRQKCNNPFKPTESAPRPRKTKGKKLSGLEVLSELQKTCRILNEKIRNIAKTNSDAEEPAEFLSLASNFTFADVPIPENIPEHIRQRFLDAEVAFQEIYIIQEEASRQLLAVRSTFLAWYYASHEVWEAGKKRIHEMPLLREYEYTRISLQAMLSVAARQEVKIVEFYKGDNAPELPLAMHKALKLESMSPKEFEEDWETRGLRLQRIFPSVYRIIEGLDSMMEETAEADFPKTEWWKWLVDGSQ